MLTSDHFRPLFSLSHQRFLTYVRRHNYTDVGYGEESPFWVDLQTRNQGPYAKDNLNAWWLSGAQGRFISEDHINIAKCRLQLFDLVIADELFEHAMKKVICPLNGLRGVFYCNGKMSGFCTSAYWRSVR